MRVFVTGGSGFIGAHTTTALLDAGHQVRLLVRNKAKAQQYFSSRGYDIEDYVVADMRDTQKVVDLMRGCDAFFHAAALVSVDADKSDEIRKTNQGTIRALMQGALDLGIDNIVYVSSLAALFSPRLKTIDESTPLGTLSSPYSTSKRECDAYVRELQAEGAPIQISYAGGVFGPDDPGLSESNAALVAFLASIPNTASGIQCIDVRDVAAAHRFLLENPVDRGSDNASARYVLGGHFYSWPEFHSLLCKITSRNIPHPRMPALLLRTMGHLFDLIRRFKPIKGPISAEAMRVSTQFPVANSAKYLQHANVEFRDGAETFSDTLVWLAKSGHIKPKWAGLESSDGHFGTREQ